MNKFIKITVLISFNLSPFISLSSWSEDFSKNSFGDIELILATGIDPIAESWIHKAVIEDKELQSKIKKAFVESLKAPIVVPKKNASGGLSDLSLIGLGSLEETFYQNTSSGKTPIGSDTQLSLQLNPEKVNFNFNPQAIKLQAIPNIYPKQYTVTIDLAQVGLEFQDAQVGASYLSVSSDQKERTFVSFCDWIGCKTSTELPHLSGLINTEDAKIQFNLELPPRGEMKVKIQDLQVHPGSATQTQVKFDHIPEKLDFSLPIKTLYEENGSLDFTLTKAAFLKTELALNKATKKAIEEVRLKPETITEAQEKIAGKISTEVNQWIETNQTTSIDLPIATAYSFNNKSQLIQTSAEAETKLPSTPQRELTGVERKNFINSIEKLKVNLASLTQIKSSLEGSRRQRDLLSLALSHALIAEVKTSGKKEDLEFIQKMLRKIWDPKNKKNTQFEDFNKKELTKIKEILLGKDASQSGSLDKLINYLSVPENKFSEEMIVDVFAESSLQLNERNIKAVMKVNEEATDLSHGVIAWDFLLNRGINETLVRPTTCQGMQPEIIRSAPSNESNISKMVIPLATLNATIFQLFQLKDLDRVVDKGVKLLQAPILSYHHDPLNPNNKKLKLVFPIESDNYLTKIPLLGVLIKNLSAKDTYEVEMDIDISIDPKDPTNLIFKSETQTADMKKKFKNLISVFDWVENFVNASGDLSTKAAKKQMDRRFETGSTGIKKSLDDISSGFSDAYLDEEQNLTIEIKHKIGAAVI